MLASVLTAAGIPHGAASPHLYRFNERFQVNGARPSPVRRLTASRSVLTAADTFPEHPTEFELMSCHRLSLVRGGRL